MDEVARLQQLLNDERRRREEAEARTAQEQHQREEAEARAAQEQHRREEAEQAARDALPSNLGRYLEDCYELWRTVKVVASPSSTTQGDTTKPAGRIYPKRILPWESFVTRQQKIWEKLSSSSFGSSRVFPSPLQLDYVRSTLYPISSETGLRNIARDIVENAVQRLVQEVYQDPILRVQLNLRGTVNFESHTNLGSQNGESVESAMRRMSVRSQSPSADRRSQSRRGRGRGNARPVGRPRGKGGRTDQFCIYRQEDGQRVPVAAIEYKAPHKLTQEIIVTGLTGEIVPGRDIIGRDDDSSEYLSKRLMAAVVTQCFSYMIHHGLRDGYIFTGEVMVFLHIPDDPTTVYYHICIPSLDVSQDEGEDDDDRLNQTAAAQIFAFVLHALATDPPPQAWHDATADLDIWEVEYVDILKMIPETDRKPGQPPSAYKPGRWKKFVRSPIRTRARCAQAAHESPRHEDSDENDGDSGPNQPSPTPAPRSTWSKPRPNTGARGDADRPGAGSSTPDASDAGSRISIQERSFCTHKCLLGLLRGGKLDQTCPNIESHGKKHVSQSRFLHLVKTQLATDRGSDADCIPLYVKGARGALFKVRLSSYGYTLVAKGMEEHHRKHLRHEDEVYEHALELQGTHIPVCLGMISLRRPYYYFGGEYMHMLFLSWAGRPLYEYINLENRPFFQRQAMRALEALHQRHVVHGDAELRNFLYDEAANRAMIIDLERAVIRKSKPLAKISPNQTRLGRRGTDEKQKPAVDAFAREIRALEFYLSRSVRRELSLATCDLTTAFPRSEEALLERR